MVKALRNYLSGFPKHHVPESVSVDIIDTLEIVQIQHNQMSFLRRIFLQPSDNFIRSRPLIIQSCQEVRLYLVNHILLACNGSMDIFNSAKYAVNLSFVAYDTGIPYLMPLIFSARPLFQISDIPAYCHMGRAVQHIQQSLYMIGVNAVGGPQKLMVAFHYLPHPVVRKIIKKNHFVLGRFISEK